MQRYKRQPRVIVKSDTEQNRVLLMGHDNTCKDSKMMEDILQGTMQINGLSIQKLVQSNPDYFLQLKMNETSPHRQRDKFHTY